MRSRLVWLAEDETGGRVGSTPSCPAAVTAAFISCSLSVGGVHAPEKKRGGLQAGADREPEVMEVSLLLLLPDRNIAVRNKGQKYDKYTAGKDSVEYCQLFLYLLKHGYPFIAI